MNVLLSPALNSTVCDLPPALILSFWSISEVTVALIVLPASAHLSSVTVARLRVLIPLSVSFSKPEFGSAEEIQYHHYVNKQVLHL